MIKGMRFLFIGCCKTTLLCFVLVLILAVPTIYAADLTSGLEISAKSAVLMDAASGEILFLQNPDEHLQIASVTKVMTLLLIMEAIDTGKITMEDKVVASEYACSMGGSQVFLEPGEQMSVSDMLKAIAVASGNDASVAMAEHIMGSAPAFVNAMNTRAKSLGMKNTNFINCNGLDGENQEEQYSSALDVAIMSRELLKHEGIKQYLTIWMDSLRNGKFGLSNTNKLIRFYTGAIGIKTGSTDKAKYCLSAAASRNDLTLISTVLSAPSSAERFFCATKLLDYGFANYAMVSGAKKGDSFGKINVAKGKDNEVEIVAGDDFKKLISKDKKGSIELKAELPQNLHAPIMENDKVGDLLIIVNNEQIGKVNLVAKSNVPRISAWSMFVTMLKRWSVSCKY